MALGGAGSEELAYEWGAAIAGEAKAFGVNYVFGPVVDIANEPRHPFANLRCLSSDKNEVVRLGTAIIKGFQVNGMQVAAKHYPGAGRFTNDNHIETIILECSREEFEHDELYVYRELIKKADLNGIMSGHIAMKEIDGNTPATVSRKLISYLDDFKFEGLLISDSLAMKGITMEYPPETLLPLCLNAGHDIILGDYNISPEYQLEILYKAYKDGIITEKRIDQSVSKIMKAKKNIINAHSEPTIKEKNASLSREINKRSITLTGDPASLKEIRKGTLFIVSRELDNEIIGAEMAMSNSSQDISKLLREYFPANKLMEVSANPRPSEIESTMNESLKYDSVVFIGYALIFSYKGTADFSRSLLAMIRGMKNKIKVFVLVGNPFAARELPELPCVLYGYHGAFAESTLVEALSGNLAPSGKLPIIY
jgi:beta-glucosidase-like glycosyl hydrolase